MLAFRSRKEAARRLLAVARPDRDPDEVEAAAAIILERIGPEDPGPNDIAFANLIAFGLQDLWAVRELLKG